MKYPLVSMLQSVAFSDMALRIGLPEKHKGAVASGGHKSTKDPLLALTLQNTQFALLEQEQDHLRSNIQTAPKTTSSALTCKRLVTQGHTCITIT